MKKLLWILFVLFMTLLLVGGCILFLYSKVDEPSVRPADMLRVEAGDGAILEVPLRDYAWYEPVLGGGLFKEFKKPAVEQLHIRFSTKSDHISVSLEGAEGLELQVKITGASGVVFDAAASELRSFCFPAAGNYQAEVRARRASSGSRAYGEYLYLFEAQVQLDTTAALSAEKAVQGDILRLLVEKVPPGVVPEGESELGPVNFIEKDGRYIAYIPVSYRQGTGERAVTVRCGEFEQTLAVWIEAGSFPKEYHHSAEGKAPIPESEAAAREYRDSLWPLFDTAEPEQYWSEPFIQPVSLPVTGQFGAYVYLDEAQEPTRNPGVDIAAERGLPVLAPNRGKVVFAGRLALTGNTVVIEHGGGVKSYLYYMDSLTVRQGDVVERGAQVGTVGDDGTSEAPHLNYELKIGAQSVDPMQVFAGKGALYLR